MGVSFDYKVIAKCEYGVYAGYDNEVVGCGEPATYKVWWKEDASDTMFVCPEHFKFITKVEKMAVRSSQQEEKSLEELREGVSQTIKNDSAGFVHLWERDRLRIADQILSYLAEKGACFPASKEDRDKMSDPMANYEIVVTLKEMIKDGS